MPRHHLEDLSVSDLALSGPHVWPVLSAEHVADRWIHRRPEVAYLRTLERSREIPGARIRGRISRIHHRPGGRKEETLVGDWTHVPLPDSDEDVRAWLRGLRRILISTLPTVPTPDLTVQLGLWVRGRCLRTHKERWM